MRNIALMLLHRCKPQQLQVSAAGMIQYLRPVTDPYLWQQAARFGTVTMQQHKVTSQQPT
jgi:hypothetical protein